MSSRGLTLHATTIIVLRHPCTAVLSGIALFLRRQHACYVFKSADRYHFNEVNFVQNSPGPSHSCATDIVLASRTHQTVADEN